MERWKKVAGIGGTAPKTPLAKKLESAFLKAFSRILLTTQASEEKTLIEALPSVAGDTLSIEWPYLRKDSKAPLLRSF